MSARFFNPWVGDHYADGIGPNEYSILVLGASAYCPRNNCMYFCECTSDDEQDSSNYNDCCPYPESDDSDEGKLENYVALFSKDYASIPRFRTIMKREFNFFDDGDFWDYVAFTDYVQYFLSHTDTYPDNLSNRDMDAFLETLDELRPDIVVVLGKLGRHPVATALSNSDYTVEKDEDDPWDFAWEYNDMFIRFICCTHPSAGLFYKDFPTFAQKLMETINDDREEEEDEEEDNDCDDEDGDENEDDWDNENDNEEYESSDDGDDDDDDDDSGFLETANDLFERLDALPRKCNNFIVRFKDVEDDDWIQPECWHIDDDRDLVFDIYDDGDDNYEFTVEDLKNILTGETTDNNDNVVGEETPVYIDLGSDDDNYRRPLDEYFRINWKKRRVEIPVRDYDYDDGDEDDEDEDGYDEDAECDEEDGNEDEDYEEESDDEDNDNSCDEEEDEDDNADDEDNSASSRNTPNLPPCDLTLGLIMERGFRQWMSGR